MNNRPAFRALSGWSLLLLGVALLVSSLMPAVLQGGRSPTAGMLGVFGLLVIGIGIALSATADKRLTEGATRHLCVALISLILGASSGFISIFVQRSTFFAELGFLYATLLMAFATLLGFAACACVAILRQCIAAFLSPSDSLLSLGGRLDPLSFGIAQSMVLILAAIGGGIIAAQAGGSREGLLLAAALAVAALPFFVMAQVAICVKRWRDARKG